MIFASPLALKVDAKGLTSQQSTVARYLAETFGGTWEFDMTPTGKRGTALNALIARVQAGRERDPFYLNKRALEAIRFLANGLASTVASVRSAAEKQIGDLMVTSVLENVQAQKNPSGSKFRPLTDEYARRKQRQVGFTLPILRLTGDLLSGLIVKVTRKK